MNRYRRRRERKSTPLSLGIARALLAEGYIENTKPEDWCIVRTNAGYWQRSAGAWSWTLEPINRHPAVIYGRIGSQWPARECLSKGFDVDNEHGSWALIPKEEPRA